MAEVWKWRDGDAPDRGLLLAERSIAECEAKLRLTEIDFWSDLNNPPCLDTQYHPPAYPLGPPNLRDYRHVVVRIEGAEATTRGWKPGFYLSPVPLDDAHAYYPEMLK